MKKEINVFDHAGDILNALGKGILLTAKAGGRVNPMTIGWGMLGIEWGKPIFITYVREGRFTRTLLDEGGDFTVNVPVGDYDKNIIGFCGSKSGRDIDKVKELGLTLVASETINSPAIKELPLTLECKIIYRRLQDGSLMPPKILERNYPADVASDFPMANRDLHIAYYGEILKAYILE